MTSVLMRPRAELRTRWRAWVSPTVTLGLFGSAAIAIAAGRWMWSAFATQLGILPASAIPIGAVLLSIPATLLLANLIAYLPGRAAARIGAATVLRTE